MAEHEIELKLGVPADRLPALRRALARGTVRHERLHAEYFDCEDERLARHRIALRLRREGRRWIQTAKASTDDAARRLEDNVPVPGSSSRDIPALDLARHAGTPVGDALQKALAGPAHDAATLVARYAIDVRRTTRTVRHAGARIELALDLGHVTAATGREQPICELEMELKAGAEAALYALAERWLAAHGLWLCPESKAARGARLARGEAAAPPVKARAPQFDGEAPTAASALRAVTRSCLEQIVGNASALADGSDDVEHVHQMRVGLRRMRSALREMGDFGGAIDPTWEPTLSQAFGELGAHRDRTVVLPRWAAEMARCGAPPLALPASTLPERDLVSIARDPRLQRTLLGLLCFSAAVANADPAGQPDDAGDARRRFAQRLQDLHEHVVRDAERFGKLDGTQQHRVRKRLKRLRYLSEFAASLFSGKTVGRYLAAMSGAQDELGTLNDEHTAADAWRRDAERQPHAWFAVGWLAARQADAVRRSEHALRLIAKAPRFWKKAVA